MSFWEGKRVLVTGGSGFPGSYVVKALREKSRQRSSYAVARCLDVTRAQAEFGSRARVPFEQGLRETTEWYRARH